MSMLSHGMTGKSIRAMLKTVNAGQCVYLLKPGMKTGLRILKARDVKETKNGRPARVEVWTVVDISFRTVQSGDIVYIG